MVEQNSNLVGYFQKNKSSFKEASNSIKEVIDEYNINHESTDTFISLGSEAIIHRLLNDLIMTMLTEIHNETNNFNKFSEVLSYLKGIATSEPNNENTKIIMSAKQPKTIEEAYEQLNLIFEYTLARGFMKIPKKEPSWEDNELLIEPANASSADIRKVINEDDHEMLYRLIMDDRDDELSPNQVHEWINLYNVFLSLYRRNVNQMRIVNRNTKKPVPQVSIEDIIEKRYLKKGKCSVLYGGQGAGKSNFLAWLVGIVLLHNPKWIVLTNLPLFTETYDSLKHLTPDRIKIIDTLSSIMTEVAKIILAGNVPVILIDEIDQSLTSHDWRSPKAKSIYNLVLIMRHLRIRMILFYHDFNHIPQWLREGDLAGEFIRLIKMPYNNEHFTFSEYTKPYSLYVPLSWIPYATHGWSGFKIDVIVEDLSEKLKGITRKQMADQIIQLVPTLEKITDKKSKKKPKDEIKEEEPKMTVNDKENNEAVVKLILKNYLDKGNYATHKEETDVRNYLNRIVDGVEDAYKEIGYGDWLIIKPNEPTKIKDGAEKFLELALHKLVVEENNSHPYAKEIKETIIAIYEDTVSKLQNVRGEKDSTNSIQ